MAYVNPIQIKRYNNTFSDLVTANTPIKFGEPIYIKKDDVEYLIIGPSQNDPSNEKITNNTKVIKPLSKTNADTEVFYSGSASNATLKNEAGTDLVLSTTSAATAETANKVNHTFKVEDDTSTSTPKASVTFDGSVDKTITYSNIGAVRASTQDKTSNIITCIDNTAGSGNVAANNMLFTFGSSTPLAADRNKLWIDTTAITGGLKYWDGSDWKHVPVAYT